MKTPPVSSDIEQKKDSKDHLTELLLTAAISEKLTNDSSIIQTIRSYLAQFPDSHVLMISHAVSQSLFKELTSDSNVIQIIQSYLNPLLGLNAFMILQAAWQNIPDEKISLENRKLITNLIDKKFALYMDTSYRNYPKLLATENKTLGKITPEQFQIILKMKNKKKIFFYYSELILLMLGVITHELDSKQYLQLRHEFMTTGSHYLYGSYVNSYEYLKSWLNWLRKDKNLFKNKSQDELKIFDLLLKPILRASENLMDVPVRRFFESKWAQLFLTEEKPRESVRKIVARLYGKNIKDIKELEDALCSLNTSFFILDQYHKKEEIYQTIVDYIRYYINYLKWDTRRTGKIDEVTSKIPLIYNSDYGIIKQTTPLPCDEHSSPPRCYAKADVNSHDNFKAICLSKTAFVSGLSGHIHGSIAVMLIYAQAWKNDPELSADISHFFISTIAAMIKRGYHSFGELFYIFEHSFIFTWFKRYGVTLNLRFPANSLLSALQFSQEYTKIYCLNKVMRAELQQLTSSVTASDIKKKPPASPRINDSDDDWELKNDESDKNSNSDDENKREPKNEAKTFNVLRSQIFSIPKPKNLHQGAINAQYQIEKKLKAWGGDELVFNQVLQKSKEDLPIAANIKLSQTLLKFAANQLGYDCKDVSGDGNCFFYAAAKQLQAINLCQEGELLRESVAFYINEYKNYYADFFTEKVSQYTQQLAKPGTWADGYTIEALARLKNVIIVIIYNDAKQTTTIFKPEGATTTITLGYEVRGHYQSLTTQSEDKIKASAAILAARAKLTEKIAETKALPSLFASIVEEKKPAEKKSIAQKLEEKNSPAKPSSATKLFKPKIGPAKDDSELFKKRTPRAVPLIKDDSFIPLSPLSLAP